MKFFHLSDLHIGLKLMNRDLREDQEYVLREVAMLAAREKPDAIVIAGDIYDKAVPSADAVEIFDGFIEELSTAVPDAEIMMISGNHDSAPRVNLYRGLLKRQHIDAIGMPPVMPEDHIERVTLQDAEGDVNFYLLPFVKPSMVKQIVGTDDNGNNLSYDETLHRLIAREEIDTSKRNVLVSHQFYLPVGTDALPRMDSEIVTVGNIDSVRADVLEAFDYAALGHIHKAMQIGCERYRYAGTPLACSVSEAGQQKGVVCVELGAKGEVTTTVLPLSPLHEVKVLRGTGEEILGEACADYVTAVLTDNVDLDVIDLQDRMRAAFPNLLEIRREAVRGADYLAGDAMQQADGQPKMSAFELCSLFMPGLDDDDLALLSDVINTVKEADA